MRIIAGSRKGHTIHAPRGLDTRPTSDRVRENVFNIVGPLDGAKVSRRFKAVTAPSKVLSLDTPGAGITFSIFSGRNSKPSVASRSSNTSRSIRFSSSRTLPGHSYS